MEYSGSYKKKYGEVYKCIYKTPGYYVKIDCANCSLSIVYYEILYRGRCCMLFIPFTKINKNCFYRLIVRANNSYDLSRTSDLQVEVSETFLKKYFCTIRFSY